MKALKFAENIVNFSSKIKQQMQKAIQMSKATDGKECGMAICSDGETMPISCGTEDYVIYPTCSHPKKTIGTFHVHTKNYPISNMDIISGIGIGSQMECLGFSDGKIKCYDLSKIAKDAFGEEVKRIYKEIGEADEINIENVKAKLKDLAKEVDKRRNLLKEFSFE